MKKRSNSNAKSGSSPLPCFSFRERVTWYKASERSPEDGEIVLVQFAENGAIEENLFRDGSYHWFNSRGIWVTEEDEVVGWWARVKGPYIQDDEMTQPEIAPAQEIER